MYRILLVDDEWLELDTLEKYIPWEEMGFQVAGTAENGKEALQLLERLEGSENEEENDRKLPDVVLTDVKMPVMDGLQATRFIRMSEKEDSVSIPIIAMSANAFSEDMKKSMESGMNGHLVKPIEVEKTRKLLEKCIK